MAAFPGAAWTPGTPGVEWQADIAWAVTLGLGLTDLVKLTCCDFGGWEEMILLSQDQSDINEVQ